jgi:hypothetical protein
MYKSVLMAFRSCHWRRPNESLAGPCKDGAPRFNGGAGRPAGALFGLAGLCPGPPPRLTDGPFLAERGGGTWAQRHSPCPTAYLRFDGALLARTQAAALVSGSSGSWPVCLASNEHHAVACLALEGSNIAENPRERILTLSQLAVAFRALKIRWHRAGPH